MTAHPIAKTAFRFVLIIGIVNLFADLTYEGARGIVGPFLGSLGASATMIGLVAGLGELAGYALRSVSGYLGDKTHRYWPIIFAGYAINMLAVPALALAPTRHWVAALVILERTGRALRRPNVEVMLSHAGKSLGRGWVFGLNEALDQTGATIGPLVVALVLYLRDSYRPAFAVLLIPALLCLSILLTARLLYPRPHELEHRAPSLPQTHGFPSSYWTLLVAGALIAAGFVDFSLIAFHFQQARIVPQSMIPIFYAVAMATAALASLLFGRLLDKYPRPTLLLAFSLPALAAPCVFLGHSAAALTGVLLWGSGLGAQDSLLKAMLAHFAPPAKRGTAFGLFDTAFGVAWFAGSATMGLLYDHWLPALILLCVLLQLSALPLLFRATRGNAREGRSRRPR